MELPSLIETASVSKRKTTNAGSTSGSSRKNSIVHLQVPSLTCRRNSFIPTAGSSFFPVPTRDRRKSVAFGTNTRQGVADGSLLLPVYTQERRRSSMHSTVNSLSLAGLAKRHSRQFKKIHGFEVCLRIYSVHFLTEIE